jgi:hypothetical protein
MCFVARARACNADRSPSSAALDAVAVAVAVAAGALTKEVDMVVAGQERLPSDNNNTMLPHPFALIFFRGGGNPSFGQADQPVAIWGDFFKKK